MLTIALLITIAALAFACWRLNGSRTTRDAIKVVIQGGGGPGSVNPPV